MDKDVRRRKADELREYVYTQSLHCLAKTFDEKTEDSTERKD